MTDPAEQSIPRLAAKEYFFKLKPINNFIFPGKNELLITVTPVSRLRQSLDRPLLQAGGVHQSPSQSVQGRI